MSRKHCNIFFSESLSMKYNYMFKQVQSDHTREVTLVNQPISIQETTSIANSSPSTQIRD